LQPKIPLVHAAGVTKLGAWHGAVTVVFNAMTVTLPTDGICALLGRPASGRTTLLRLLSGAARPDRGSILSEIQFSSINNAGTFFNPRLTGLENITAAARIYGMDPAMLTDTALELSRFDSLWQIPAGALPGQRRRAMELLLSALLPFDCYLVDNVESSNPDTFALVLQILARRGAGMIFTTRNARFAQEFATIGGVIRNQTVYAFSSVGEALEYYGE